MDEPVDKITGARAEGITVFLVLLAIFVAMLAYGVYLGNVFETHHNGSNL